MHSNYFEFVKFMYSFEHFQELRHRTGFCIIVFLLLVFSIFLSSPKIFCIFQKTVIYVKIVPVGMSDFLYTSIKLSILLGIFFMIFFSFCQGLLYFLPGFTRKEKNSILSASIVSIMLFSLGATFCKFYLVPATFNFFMFYSFSNTEVILRLDNYVNILLTLTITTGIFFQIPIIQFLLRYLGIISGNDMLKVSKYVIVLFSFFSAIITPSTDPYPQVLLSIAISSLYIAGATLVKLTKQ